MQVKKWVATGLAALMAGATLAGAALAATTLGQFPGFLATTTTTGSALNALVVVGATAYPSDVVGAIDLATSLASANYNSVSTGGASSTVSVSGGTSLSTVGNPLYLGASLNSVKSTLTATDLSTLLGGGTLNINKNGDQYTFTQYLDMQSRPNVTFDTASGSTAPVLGLYFPGSAAAYKYRLVFAKPVAETGTNLKGNSLSILGGTYVVSSTTNDTSGFTEIDLLGGPSAQSLTVGQSASFTSGSTTYALNFSSVATSGSTNVAVVSVNGQTYNLYDGSPIQLSDGTWVGAVNVLTVGSAGSGTATFFVGGNKVALTVSGGGTNTGTLSKNNNVVSGASVTFTGNAMTATNPKISEIDIQYSPSTDQMIQTGGTYTDPVFGAFKFAFGGITPSLSDTTNRQTVSITPSSTVAMGLSFKTVAGNTLTQNYAYNASGAINAKDASGNAIHLNESDVVAQNEYAVVSQGTIPNVYGHVLQLTSETDPTSSAAGTVTFTDVASGTSYQVSTSSTGYVGSGTLYLDGYSYNVSNTSTASANKVTIRWANSGTQPLSTSGSTQYIYPSIKSAQGANIAIAGPVSVTLSPGSTIANFTRLLQFPTSSTTVNLTFENDTTSVRLLVDGTTVLNDTATNSFPLAKQVGKAWYVLNNVTELTNGTTSLVVTIDVANKQSASSTTTLGVPSIIVMEDRDNNSNRHSIVVPTTATSTQVGATTPLFTNGITGSPSVAGASQNQYMDYWGSQVTYSTPSTGANTVTISYPNQQSTATVSVGISPTTSTVTSAGGTVNQVKAITSSIAKLDTEVTATDKTANDLVLVGGPCVNSLVQSLVGATNGLSSAYTCAGGTPGSAWVAGNAYIMVLDDAFATGHQALVVAGMTAADTRLATSVLQAGKLASDTRSKVLVSGTVANPTFGTPPA